MTRDLGYLLEGSAEGRSLIVTGRWSTEAADALARGEADSLVLNYARGFAENSLEFLDSGWNIRRLDLLDRGVTDLAPICRLRDSLEELSIQVAPNAKLDLGALPRLHSLSGEWALLRDTQTALTELQTLVTWQFDEDDLRSFRDHVDLQRLTIKEAPELESLSGVADLPELAVLGVFLARKLHDIEDLVDIEPSARHVEFQDCPSINTVDAFQPLINLRFLGVSDCGTIESLGPLSSLESLEVLYAWGSTRVLDEDLSPLARLPRLREIRMRDRRGYRPHVAELVASLSIRGTG